MMSNKNKAFICEVRKALDHPYTDQAIWEYVKLSRAFGIPDKMILAAASFAAKRRKSKKP